MSYGFSLFPPEILSGLMYTGPGAGPLLEAATAWTGMSEELTTTATSVQSQISGLSASYQGPTANLMGAAIAPYVSWLETTSSQAAQMASQATTAAGLFETAHAATVPPPVIAANRSLLLALIATNFFGQNTPAIMATEAQYEAMWGQDAATMESYAAASDANNSALQQPTPPPQAGQPHPAAQPPPNTPPTSGDTPPTPPTWNDVMTDIGQGQWASAWTAAQSLLAGGTGTPPVSNPNALMQALYYPLMYGAMPIRYLMMLTSLFRGGAMGSALAGQAAGAAAANGPGALMTQIGDFVNDKMQGAVGTLVGHFNTATQAISAKLGQAASMGSLKVPQAWSMAADGMVRAAPVLPQTVSAPATTVSATSGMPGGPFGNAMLGALAGRGLGSVAAKAPKVVPRSPAGG